MATRKKGRRHSNGKFVSIAVVAGVAPGLVNAYNGYRASGVNGAVNSLTRNYTGFDTSTRQWRFENMLEGWAPLAGGILVHKIANMLGVNRMLARSIFSFIRI